MEDRPSSWQALSGLFALFVLSVSTVIFTALRPSYDHLEYSFSQLGEFNAPNFIAFNFIAFGLVGILSIYFYHGVKKFYNNHLTRNQYLSYILASFCWIMTGIFPVSYDIEWLYAVHLGAAFMSYLLGCTCMAMSIKLFTEVNGFEIYALITFWCLFVVWGSILTSFTILTAEMGQLISIFTFFIWQSGYSIQFYRVINRQ